VIEVEERVLPVKAQEEKISNSEETPRTVTLANEQQIQILSELNLEKLENDLVKMMNKTSIKNVAVLLMHSYIYNEHECQIQKLTKRLGIKSISLSHQISPMIRAVPRGLTSKFN